MKRHKPQIGIVKFEREFVCTSPLPLEASIEGLTIMKKLSGMNEGFFFIVIL